MGFWILIFTLLGAAQASDESGSSTVKPGAFDLATEAGWSASIELKKNGVAVIIPSHDTEEFDRAVKSKAKVKPIPAQWKAIDAGIEITYLNQKDQFRFEGVCTDWPEYSCLRYLKSIPESKSDQSLLKFEPPFIDWQHKHLLVRKAINPKLCSQDCEQLAKEGSLKSGMTVEDCIQKQCKTP